jgi:hypothetical protein
MPFEGVKALDWSAVVREIRDAAGNPIPPEIGRGVYRDDTDTILSVCGPNFKPIQHGDVLDPVLQTLKDQGYDIKERAPDQKALYDLKGQRGAFVSVDDAHNGAVVRFQVITGDFTQPTGPVGLLPERRPPLLMRRYLGLNSHNSTYAAQVVGSYVNVICMNGMVREDFSAVMKAKHTTGFNQEAFRRKVLAATEMMEADTERFKLYIKTPLSIPQAAEFLKATIAKLADKPTGEPHWSDPLVNDLLGRFSHQPPTVWGLYQAMTEWATHGALRQNATALTARVQRDERVAKTMRSSEFKALIAA